MSRLSLTPMNVPDAFQSMYRQMVEPWRNDDWLLEDLFRPSLRAMDPIFGPSFDILARSFSNNLRLGESLLGGLDVHVDVVERNGTYRVRADLPGVKKEDINVRIDGNTVNIEAKAQDSAESKDTDGKVVFSERYCGAVSRTFKLDKDLDETKATGKYTDGVLTLYLPKKEGVSKVETKAITIQ